MIKSAWALDIARCKRPCGPVDRMSDPLRREAQLDLLPHAKSLPLQYLMVDATDRSRGSRRVPLGCARFRSRLGLSRFFTLPIPQLVVTDTS